MQQLLPTIKPYRGFCETHGAYESKRVYFGHKILTDLGCPQCKAEALAKEQKEEAEAEARRAADRMRVKIQKATARSCIPAEYIGKTFENFAIHSENQRDAFYLARRFVTGWKKAKAGGYGLLFFGSPGTGKTHLACAIIQALIVEDAGVYVRAADIIMAVRATWRGQGERSEAAVIEGYSTVPLLVIDEVGVQAGSENEQQILFNIIDTRLSENRPTIFITNLTPDAFSRCVGERLADRIRSKCVPYFFKGMSMRSSVTADVFGTLKEMREAA